MNEWLSPAALMEVLEEIAGSIDELLIDTPNISRYANRLNNLRLCC